MRDSVQVIEVGPRDGLQMVPATLPTETKVRWIQALANAGIAEIEVGSFVPPKLVPQMADTEAVVRATRQSTSLTVAALVPNLKGAQRAKDAGVQVIVVPISVSERHSRSNTHKGTFDQVQEVKAIIEWNREQAAPMVIEAGCSTAFGCSMEGRIDEARVVEVASALAAVGVDRLALADTVGYAHPAAVRSAVRAVRAEIGGVLTKLHLHDTLGLGLANVLAGLEEGIRSFDAACAGLGGCPFAPGASGNIVTEDLVFMLESMGFATGIDLRRLLAARAILQEAIPDEPMRGSLAVAGIPKTFAAAA
jgi:hydroxymethylglutaryl-CoA lyase